MFRFNENSVSCVFELLEYSVFGVEVSVVRKVPLSNIYRKGKIQSERFRNRNYLRLPGIFPLISFKI